MENMKILLVIIGAIAVTALFLRGLKKLGSNRNLDTNEEEVEKIDFNDEFLNDKMKSDKTPINAIRMNSFENMMIIRSMLYNAGINSFAEFEHMNNIMKGANITGYNDLIITLFQEDIDDAVEVINEYNRNINNDKEVNGISVLRNMAELLIGGWVVGENYIYSKVVVNITNR